MATVSTCKEQVLKKKGISLNTNFMFCGKHVVMVNKELGFHSEIKAVSYSGQNVTLLC